MKIIFWIINVTQQISYVHNLHALYRLIAYTTVWNCWICIIFDWYFVHVIWPLFHIQILLPVESVYWLHIVFPSHILFSHLCWVNFLLCGLLNLICYEQWSALCVVYSGQCFVLGVVSLAGLAISRQRFGGQIRFDRVMVKNLWHHTPQREDRLQFRGNHDVIWLENLCLAGICKGME